MPPADFGQATQSSRPSPLSPSGPSTPPSRASDAGPSQPRTGYSRAEFTAPWDAPSTPSDGAAPPPQTEATPEPPFQPPPAAEGPPGDAGWLLDGAGAPGTAGTVAAPGSAGSPPSRAPRKVLWSAGAIAVLIGGYVAAAWLLSGSAPEGTTVAGVPVGGKDHAGIVAALTQARAQQNGKLEIALGNRQTELDLARSGLSVDPAATAGKLTGFSLSPASVWRHLRGGTAEEAVGAQGKTLREGTLETTLRGASVKLTVKPVDAAVTFTGGSQEAPEPAVTGGTAGTVLNISRSAEVIRQGWLGGKRPLPLPAGTQEPQITKAEAQKALDELAKPALAGPLNLQVGAVKVAVQPADFAPALTITPDQTGTLRLTVNGERLTASVLGASPQIGTAPKDARIELKNGRPHIVPGVQGVTLDPEKAGSAVLAALTSDNRTASVPTKVQAPKFTTQDAEKLGVTQKVSTFSTVLTSNRLRTQNLRVAARTVNGTLVMPGATFSLPGTLGERPAAKGYHQAPAINGGRLVQDYGGGVSQMATTIFNNVFFAGLEDIHHKPHSFYISRYPEGREATVNYPTVDLKWRNDSKYGVLIQANVTNRVNVSFWSTKVWDITSIKSARSNPRTPGTEYDDGPGCVSQEANPGFDVSVTRVFKQSGREVRRETFHTTYIAEDKVVCGPKPAAKSAGDQD